MFMNSVAPINGKSHGRNMKQATNKEFVSLYLPEMVFCLSVQ